MVDLTKHMKKGLVEQKPGQILAFKVPSTFLPKFQQAWNKMIPSLFMTWLKRGMLL